MSRKPRRLDAPEPVGCACITRPIEGDRPASSESTDLSPKGRAQVITPERIEGRDSPWLNRELGAPPEVYEKRGGRVRHRSDS